MDRTDDVERFARVKALFGSALSLRGEARAHFLASECGGDEGLRAEVTELLEHASASDDFLDGVAHAAELPATDVDLSIPGYHLLEHIGTGASGVVYRAIQDRPRREVAVKVLRLDTLAAGQVARFQREAEILARLGHPGIAQVLGAGVAESAAGALPWIAMEFVRGRELAHWVAEERPGARAKVEFFVALCEAVQHAHGRGVVHRDLKPSNVLVTDGARPKVLDFGIARTLEDERATSERTRTGLVMGTLAYMAPEQARGEQGAVGPACDVYALGVMLFEALAGRLPLELEAADVLEGVRIVCEVEPLRLRALVPELPADLETILIKALEKDPLRRYVSAGALGADLMNWLGDRPVLARRPTITYQARKFVRRNRALTISAGVVIASLLLGLVQLMERLAAEQRGTARMSVLTSRMARSYFDLAERLGFSLQDRQAAEELVAEIEGQLALDPEYRPLQVMLATALEELGLLHQSSRELNEAGALFRRALELREALIASDPEDRESQSALSQLCAKVGETVRDLGDPAGGERWFEQALTRDEELVARYPDDLELREDLGWSLERLAEAIARGGDEPAALELRKRRLAEALELFRRAPDNWKCVRNLSHAHYYLIGVDPSLDHAAECLRHARREVELRPEAREALIWLLEAERGAFRDAVSASERLAHAEAALEIAFQLMRADPHRYDHLGRLRLAGIEALRVAAELERMDLARRFLAGVREHARMSLTSPGLESCARLVRAESSFAEAVLSAREGADETARTLEAAGRRDLVEAALVEPALPADLELLRDLVSAACHAREALHSEFLASLFDALLVAGAGERAGWLADELTLGERLPAGGALELDALRARLSF